MNIEEIRETLQDSNNLSVIFQLTDKCVLSCKYCFARGAHKGDNPRVSGVLLEKVITQAFDTKHEEVTFEWTGGEAFLMGVEFYKTVTMLQKKYASRPYSNCIQTSGYLFDKKLIDYLVDNGFIISLTIDGTKPVHDANRPAQSSKESFDKVMETRAYIAEKQGFCGFISTITKNNLGHEKEILDFFGSLGIDSFHSNPYIYFAENIIKDKTLALSSKDYASYFISQFNSWYERGKVEPVPITIDYFLRGLSSKMPSTHTLCVFGGRCLTNFIAITPNGDCYNCPKFTGHSNMRLGCLNDMSIKEILDIGTNGKMSSLISQRLEAINKCEESHCRFAYLCNGGCPYYSYISSGGENISEKDCLCEGKTILLEYLDSIKDAIIEGEI
ncbi:MAG: radical SAM protein [Bacteroidaceae bacterium]|nr:radical SAM protein [Bacteroidaceae bacterium]